MDKNFSVVTKEITKEQIWKLMADVDHWKNWDNTVEYSKLHGVFKAGSCFTLKPKGGPKVKIRLIRVEPCTRFADLTRFPLAQMYGDHIFEAVPEGLKITVTMSVKGLLSFLWIQLVAKNIVAQLPEDVANQIAHAKNIQL